MTINLAQLETALRNVRGATICSLVLLTKCDVLKSSLFHGRDVRKRSHRSVVIGFRYASAVNRQRVREDKTPDFVAEPRKWGKRIRGTPLVEHHGRLYLECKVERTLSYHYEVDGRIEQTAIVEPNLRDGGRSDRQDLERPVVLRDPMLESIKFIAMSGHRYEVREQCDETKASA